MKKIIAIFFVALLVVLLLNVTPLKQAVQAQAGQFSDDFSSDTGQWEYMGAAHRDATNQTLVLTEASNMQAGVAYFKVPINGPFIASFRYGTGGGFPGDGFTMFFYKDQYPSGINFYDSFTPNSAAGWRSGFNTGSIIAGYGIEFDGWKNIPWDFQQLTGSSVNPAPDPSDHHIALIKDYTGNHLASVDDLRVYDGAWHDITVIVDVASVSVIVDNSPVLQWNGTIDRTYSGFGFSAGNGQCGSQYHMVDDLFISSGSIQNPTLTTFAQTSMMPSSFNVHISGTLILNEKGIANAPVYLSYSITNGDTWQDLTLVNTDSEGDYSVLWLVNVTGNYMLKAVYKGDGTHLGITNIINFIIEPCTDKTAFSINSNSTVTALVFDSNLRTLSFNVTGEAGTTGFVNVYIPTSMMNDASGLTVSLDGSQIDHTIQSLSDSWLLIFTYHHSTHAVTIKMDNPNSNSRYLDYSIYVIAMIITVLAVVSALTLRRRKNLKIDHKTHPFYIWFVAR